MNLYKLIIILITCINSLSVLSQDKDLEDIENLISEQNTDEIIKRYANKYNELSAKSLYYVGEAYNYKSNFLTSLNFMNLSLKKNPNDDEAHLIKAYDLQALKKYDEAIESYKKAILLNPNGNGYNEDLGDLYFEIKKYHLALEIYEKSMILTGASRSLLGIKKVYLELNELDKAVKIYYEGKSKVEKKSNVYVYILSWIGKIEEENGNYEKAQLAYEELITNKSTAATSNYYLYISDLISIHHNKNEYEKAKSYVDILYKDHKNGLINLPGVMGEYFILFNFKLNNYLVLGSEKYDDNDAYSKHDFSIYDKNNELLFTVVTKYSPVTLNKGGYKYYFSKEEKGIIYKYDVGLNANYNYKNLKDILTDILLEKVIPLKK